MTKGPYFATGSVDIDEGVVLRLERDGLGGAGREAHIEKERLGRARLHRTFDPIDGAGDHLGADAMGELDGRNAIRRDVLIARLRHLVLLRQVHPELEALHQAFLLLWHLGVDDAAAGGHPLHRARGQKPFVARVVTVTHPTGEHVGDGLEAAMRMIGKAGQIGIRIIGAERIQHQERIEVRQRRLADNAGELDAGAVAGGHAGAAPDDPAAYGVGLGGNCGSD